MIVAAFCLTLNALAAPMVDKTKFDRILAKAESGHWSSKPIGECVGLVAEQLLGTPYVGGTLDGSANESCTVVFEGLDCVTFAETSLGFARMLRRGGESFDDLVSEVTYTRYRGGILDGYASRLHYTSDWIRDNDKKGTIQAMTKIWSGAKPLKGPFDFMTAHASRYSHLANDPEMVEKVRHWEQDLSASKPQYFPFATVRKMQAKLQTGDIIAISDTRPGLDFAHVGLIIRRNGVPHFVHASSADKKVVFDVAIADYLARSGKKQGIAIARPLEPKR
ncbi:MAG: DUF1460 domain-containing protein [Chthonomonas sp.]|nr:DUF1460 domain-containing protein [Chthonomonas sp.]